MRAKGRRASGLERRLVDVEREGWGLFARCGSSDCVEYAGGIEDRHPDCGNSNSSLARKPKLYISKTNISI